MFSQITSTNLQEKYNVYRIVKLLLTSQFVLYTYTPGYTCTCIYQMYKWSPYSAFTEKKVSCVCMNTVHLCTHVLEQYLLCTLCIYTHILMYSDTLLKCALLIYRLNTCTRLVYSSTLLVVYTVHINTCTS